MTIPDTLLKDNVKYGPVNRCIYCGAIDVPLTDEHILPDGLGGTHILLQASCRPCADLINREFESYVLRVLLGPFREKFDIKSKKSAKKKRLRAPQKLILNKRDGSTITVYPEKENLPPLLTLPVLEIPGILRGKLGHDETWAMFHFPAEMEKYLKPHDAVSVQIPPLDIRKFLRWIAKIAHAYGVAHLGAIFEPALPKFILEGTGPIMDFVGGIPEEAGNRKQPAYLLGVAEGVTKGGDSYATVLLRIFAQYGAPLYLISLGRLTGPWPFRGAECNDPAEVSLHIPRTKPYP